MKIIPVPPGHMLNFDGSVMDPLDSESGEVSLLEIARSLSLSCRWMGKIFRFYSIAEHSLMVSQIAMALALRRGDELSDFERANIGLAGALHDATEAYLCDIPRPVKERPEMVFYREAETLLHRRIFAEFGLNAELPQEVIEADFIALQIEQRDLRPQQIEAVPLPADDFGFRLNRVVPQSQARIERRFIKTVCSLQEWRRIAG